MSRVAVCAFAVVLAACQGPTGPRIQDNDLSFQQHQSANFTFHYTAIDAATIGATASRVEAEHGRIAGNLRATDMPRVHVRLYPDQTTFQDTLRPSVTNLPTFATGLLGGPTSIHMVSPNQTLTWSYEVGIRAVVHEFAHAVSWHINPTIPNNPRWLWEAIATFEAGDFVHPHNVAWLVANQPPDVAALTSNGYDNVGIYDVGFVLGEFIVARWGRDGLAALLRNNGDVPAVTGLNLHGFFTEWAQHVRRQYFAANHSAQPQAFRPSSPRRSRR